MFILVVFRRIPNGYKINFSFIYTVSLRCYLTILKYTNVYDISLLKTNDKRKCYTVIVNIVKQNQRKDNKHLGIKEDL